MKLLVASLLVASVLVTVGAWTIGRHDRNGQNVSVWTIQGIDNSVSARYLESHAVFQASSLAIRLNPDDHLTLYRVDHTATEFFDGPPPSSRDSLLRIMVGALRKGAPDPGTRPALFWAAVADRVATSKVPVQVVYYSDGENDDVSAGSRLIMRHAALALARNAHVFKITVIGADPKNWAHIRADFAPLGQRLTLSPSTLPDIDGIVRAVDSARNHHYEEASSR